MRQENKDFWKEELVENVMTVLDHYDVNLDNYQTQKIENELKGYFSDAIANIENDCRLTD